MTISSNFSKRIRESKYGLYSAIFPIVEYDLELFIHAGLKDVYKKHLIFIENNGSPIPGRRNVGSVSNVVGFFGVSRSNNTNIKLIVGDMYNETDAVSNITYASRVGLTSYVFWYNQIGIGKAYQSDARISFYSIGQDVNLTLLKNRIPMPDTITREFMRE